MSDEVRSKENGAEREFARRDRLLEAYEFCHTLFGLQLAHIVID